MKFDNEDEEKLTNILAKANLEIPTKVVDAGRAVLGSMNDQMRVLNAGVNVFQKFKHNLYEAVACPLPYYSMERKPRGMCVIINNQIFWGADRGGVQLTNRAGSEHDAEELSRTFDKLHFKVRKHDNLTDVEIKRLMRSMSKRNHEAHDAFVCCVLSHGTQDKIYGSNGMEVDISEMTYPFQAQLCRTLAGKPKLFFIQACRGGTQQEGTELQADGVAKPSAVESKELIPNEADFLFGYATVAGYVSYRNRSSGSWYIQSLCRMLNKFANRKDILEILLMVNKEVSESNAQFQNETYKQVPAPLYTLGNKLIFRECS